MPRETLIEYFADLESTRGEFLVHDDGFRLWRYSYRQVASASRAFGARLFEAGVRPGEKIVVWGESRPEWIVAFWGSILAGAVVVPVDYRASREFASKVARLVDARLLVAGDETAGALAGEPLALPPGCRVWALTAIDWDARGAPPEIAPSATDVAEIIFTSGATADPKGVLITHRNILANIVPVEREVHKYRRYGRPFFPLRFLDLLPLSHMFGQALATFIPPMLPGTTVFLHGHNPAEIVRVVRERRVSILVAVPKILEVLRDHVVRAVPLAAEAAGATSRRRHVARRWWRYREVHRLFGPKFWCFVVGAAPLERELEAFWSRLGFLVIQGYGLTETAPIVTLNHPFSARGGSVGKAIGGVEVKIGPDGEVLVRGDNVTAGYLGAPPEAADAFDGGWLRTGDIGELDADGRLYIRGRKKEMIVTSEGLNVFPEDVERVLNRVDGVCDSAVVGAAGEGGEQVHAVLVLAAGVDEAVVVREANARLAPHQKIRGASIWPDAELPRTEGTGKIRRREIKARIDAGAPGARDAEPRAATDPVEAILTRFAGGRSLTRTTSLDEIGLSSLDKVELLVALEERFGTRIDETAFARARDVSDLRALASEPAPAIARQATAFPAWSRSGLVRAVRTAGQAILVRPPLRLFASVRVEGLEHLSAIDPPVIFAANHQSHLDTPVVLAALPRRWRRHLAVAMVKEFFSPHFFPAGQRLSRRLWYGLLYYLAVVFFNGFPIPQREAGTRETLRYVGGLVSDGFSVLIFPEGRRTPTGEILPFRSGVGMIAARARVRVVPVRLEGVNRVLHPSWRMARPGRVGVRFGRPLDLHGNDYRALASAVEAAVRQL